MIRIEIGEVYKDTDSVKTKQELNVKYGMNVQYNSIMDRANNAYDQLPDYMQRVFTEAQELNIKRKKLDKYLAKELRELDLMRRQLNSMEQYLDCLLQRLDMYV